MERSPASLNLNKSSSERVRSKNKRRKIQRVMGLIATMNSMWTRPSAAISSWPVSPGLVLLRSLSRSLPSTKHHPISHTKSNSFTVTKVTLRAKTSTITQIINVFTWRPLLASSWTQKRELRRYSVVVRSSSSGVSSRLRANSDIVMTSSLLQSALTVLVSQPDRSVSNQWSSSGMPRRLSESIWWHCLRGADRSPPSASAKMTTTSRLLIWVTIIMCTYSIWTKKTPRKANVYISPQSRKTERRFSRSRGALRKLVSSYLSDLSIYSSGASLHSLMLRKRNFHHPNLAPNLDSLQ